MHKKERSPIKEKIKDSPDIKKEDSIKKMTINQNLKILN